MRDLVRYIFELAPRLVALTALWGAIEVLVSGEVFVRLQWFFSAQPPDITQVLFLMYVAVAVLTILTGSPFAYSLATMMLALSGRSVGFQYVVPILVLLIFDNLRTTYREGELTSIRLESRKSFFTALAWGSVLIVIYVSVGLLIGIYIHGLIMGFIELSNPLTRNIAENIVVRLFLFTTIAYVSYRLVSDMGDVIALFALPSRSVSLAELRSVKPPFAIDAPLSTLRALVIASVLAPLAYAGVEKLVDIMLPNVLNDIYRLLVSMGALIGVWRVVSLALKLYEFRAEPRSVLFGATSVWLIIYLVGVVLSITSGRSLLDSLIAPDMGGVASLAARIYIDYYARYIILLEALTYITGVAP